MSRWFVRVQASPGVYRVYYGPKDASPQQINAALRELIPAYDKPDLEWRKSPYRTKPLWTREDPKRTGWRVANSEHLGDGVRWFTEIGKPVRVGDPKW